MHRVLTDIQIKILNGMRENMPEKYAGDFIGCS